MDEADEAGFPSPGFSARPEAGADACGTPAPISFANENGRSWEMVAASYYDCAIFPPHLHEGIYLRSELYQTLVPPHTPHQQADAAIASYFQKKEKEDESGTSSKPLLISAQRTIVSWLELIRSKVPGRCEGSPGILGVGVGVCVFAALAGFLLYLRRRHRLEKEFLLFLIQEKDQRIKLLLHQIAELDAILAAHRKVPVLRKT